MALPRFLCQLPSLEVSRGGGELHGTLSSRGKSCTHSKAGREAGGGGFDSGEGGIVGDECGDELAQRDGGRQRLVGQRRASERAGVVRAQPAEDLAPLVRVPV